MSGIRSTKRERLSVSDFEPPRLLAFLCGLAVLSLLIGVFLWQHRTWLPAVRRQQAQARLNQDLETAAAQNQAGQVRRLLDAGAGLNATDEQGDPAAFQAARYFAADALRVFLDRGFGVDARSGRGESLLGAAAAEGNAEGVRLLLERGADVRAEGPDALRAAQAELADRAWMLGVRYSSRYPEAARGRETEEARLGRGYGAVIALLRHAGGGEQPRKPSV